jgi:twitching motility protein PilT
MDSTSFHKLLAFGIDKGVSDIHFEVGYPPHYRLQGELLGAMKVPALKPGDTEDIARLILDGRPIDLGRSFAEQDVSYSIPGTGRFRASIFRQRGSIGIVMRVIPHKVRSFEELQLPQAVTEIVTTARRGMILVTGATGMGKTTTIAAMVRHINETRRAHIVTIEDPIEYLFEAARCMIIQREVGSDTGSFKDALAAALRQDPDVLMVGEIRDRDTAEICLRAAETGHLVISAIHTPDAASTIQRLIGMYPTQEQEVARERMAEAINAVVSLRLLVAKAGGGRIPAVEILRLTRTIRECIKAPGRLLEVAQHMRGGREMYGMQLFDQHLLDLVQSGRISVEAAIFAASNPEEFERSMAVE